MTTILVVEGNTPELVARALKRGNTGLAALYKSALLRLEPNLNILTVAPYEGEALVLDEVDAVAFTGSGVDWLVDDPRGAAQVRTMEQVFAAGLPVFGSCNGMQIAAHVLGGKVAASPKGPEDGLARNVTLTEAGRAHPMMAGRPERFAVPCTHRDEVCRLPDGAVLLAGNEHTPVQVFAHAQGGVDFWGVQYHPEYTPAFVAHGLARYRPGTETLQAALLALGDDAAAAEKLGTTAEEQEDRMRMTELRNWLAHVAARAKAVAA